MITSDQVYIVTWSYDWQEDFKLIKSDAELEAFLADTFDLDDTIPFMTNEYREALVEAYESDDWKSFQILKLDLLTNTLTGVLI